MSALRRIQGSVARRRFALLAVFVAFLLPVAPLGVTLARANPGLTDPDDIHELSSIESLLTWYVAAVGGREAILELGTRVASMRVVTDLERDPPVYEVDTLSVYGTSSGKFLVVTRTQRGTMLEGCNGDEEWKVDRDGAVFNFHAGGARDRWMTDPQFPLKLRAYFPDMEVVGVDLWGGDWIYVVDIDGDESHRLGFDVETGLLTRMGYNRRLRDYREVGGVLMPMRVACSRKGGSSTFFVDAVEHNVSIDPTLFSLAK